MMRLQPNSHQPKLSPQSGGFERLYVRVSALTPEDLTLTVPHARCSVG